MIEDKKLDSISGGGIKDYEIMVQQMLKEGYSTDDILRELQNKKESLVYNRKGHYNEMEYDKIQYEKFSINTVIERLKKGVYLRNHEGNN